MQQKANKDILHIKRKESERERGRNRESALSSQLKCQLHDRQTDRQTNGQSDRLAKYKLTVAKRSKYCRVHL